MRDSDKPMALKQLGIGTLEAFMSSNRKRVSHELIRGSDVISGLQLLVYEALSY